MKRIVKHIVLRYMKHYWGERCNPRMIPEIGNNGEKIDCCLCEAWDAYDLIFKDFD